MATTDPNAQQGIISSAIGPTTSYNGQQVLGKDNAQFMGTLQTGVDTWKAATGQTMSLEDYDKMANPTTYGARWGIPADQMPAATPAPAPAPAAAPAVKPASSAPPPVATWTVTPDQTVEGRIQSIVNSGSPIIASARAGAVDQMNARGLSNSSLATTASDAAAYQAAIPIAGADAATFAKAGGYNADIQNQMTMQGRQLDTQKGIAQLQSDTQRYGYDTTAATQKYTTDTNAKSQQVIAGMDNANRVAVQQLQNDNQKLIQTNSNAASAFNQSMVAIANIEQNDKMDAPAKTAAIAQIMQNLQQQLTTLGKVSGIDLSGTLNFSNMPGFDANGQWVGFGAGTTAAPGSGGGGDGNAVNTQ